MLAVAPAKRAQPFPDTLTLPPEGQPVADVVAPLGAPTGGAVRAAPPRPPVALMRPALPPETPPAIAPPVVPIRPVLEPVPSQRPPSPADVTTSPATPAPRPGVLEAERQASDTAGRRASGEPVITRTAPILYRAPVVTKATPSPGSPATRAVARAVAPSVTALHTTGGLNGAAVNPPAGAPSPGSAGRSLAVAANGLAEREPAPVAVAPAAPAVALVAPVAPAAVTAAVAQVPATPAPAPLTATAKVLGTVALVVVLLLVFANRKGGDG